MLGQKKTQRLCDEQSKSRTGTSNSIVFGITIIVQPKFTRAQMGSAKTGSPKNGLPKNGLPEIRTPDTSTPGLFWAHLGVWVTCGSAPKGQHMAAWHAIYCTVRFMQARFYENTEVW